MITKHADDRDGFIRDTLTDAAIGAGNVDALLSVIAVYMSKLKERDETIADLRRQLDIAYGRDPVPF